MSRITKTFLAVSVTLIVSMYGMSITNNQQATELKIVPPSSDEFQPFLSTTVQETISAIESITGQPVEAEQIQPIAEQQPQPTVQPAQTKIFSDLDFSDIDNLEDQDSGNWYIKRVLLKKAGPKHNKIRQKVSALSELKNVFFNKKTDIEKQLNEFFLKLGFQKVNVENQLEQVNKELEDIRQKEGLTEQERQILNELNQKKKDLENLNEDLKLLKELDSTLNEAISKLLEQIDIARGYETKAWQYYEGIADILDDQKARNYYQQIEVLLDNVEAIEKYVEDQFKPYIDQTTEKINTLMSGINEKVENLRAKGIELKQEIEEAAKKAEDERAAALAREKARKEKEAKQQRGFFSKIFAAIGDFFVSFWEIISWPFKWLFGATKPVAKKVVSQTALKITTT
ncbi:hypothetical protein M1446_03005 [Candidatus Dependentiae bacterium]|nr:hypothetical protein [Candidatus Dependentiae bacterium]